MGNQNNKNKQKNNANNQISTASQLKCPKCNFNMPPNSNISEVSYFDIQSLPIISEIASMIPILMLSIMLAVHLHPLQ